MTTVILDSLRVLLGLWLVACCSVLLLAAIAYWPTPSRVASRKWTARDEAMFRHPSSQGSARRIPRP